MARAFKCLHFSQGCPCVGMHPRGVCLLLMVVLWRSACHITVAVTIPQYAVSACCVSLIHLESMLWGIHMCFRVLMWWLLAPLRSYAAVGSRRDVATIAGGAWRGVQLSCTCRPELRWVKLVSKAPVYPTPASCGPLASLQRARRRLMLRSSLVAARNTAAGPVNWGGCGCGRVTGRLIACRRWWQVGGCVGVCQGACC